MTPAARVQAAIEILDLVIAAARGNGPPADRIIADWFKARRYAGSSDRRAVRDLVYAAIRRCGEVPQSGRAAMLTLANADLAIASLFDGSAHAPAPTEANERYARPGAAPKWLERTLAGSDIVGSELSALLERAPLDVRVNALKAERDGIQLPVVAEQTLARHGLRLPHGTQIEPWDAYRAGQLEVQDTGSQLACEAVGARPGEIIIDLCAGAGGKTLALAAAMDNRGVLIASDTDKRRLSQLPPRAERAGVSIVETVLLDPGKEADMTRGWAEGSDAVLIDAPCSGTGTWRRNPEARWRLTAKQLQRYAETQSRLLDLGATLVRPGGRLIYVVCSLLDQEGVDQVAAFLSRNVGWRVDAPPLPAGRPRGNGIRLTPLHDGTDGFFIARLTRT